MMAIGKPHIKILAIEHERSVLDEIRSALDGAGITCQGAADAETAGLILEQFTPDLILVDINLAGQSGVDVCDELREQAHLTDVPVMFLSGAQGPDIIRRRNPRGGTSYYLRKPFDAPVLVQL